MFLSTVISKLYQIVDIRGSMGSFCSGTEEEERIFVKTKRHRNSCTSQLEQLTLFPVLNLSWT